MHELLCTWVPGTIDVVRLKVSGRTIELTSTRLARIFGPQALNDLYLKGRTVLQANPQQVALLA
ncbi:hypothetical protein E5F05_07745 [Deinococcus metallilatus]|uniref:Uncharacterized protein n=2 Tax=Deinococcus TaxID=1298 RepID=A0AAJ5JYZ8_9DEIO|nr:hypothetical protein [Deinococcus metallilatus]MBB5297012.1 hypothetical protein [Deinococcus metallilatus]QBY07854.1 hypothetical protein E5F05_07745 [Deinococcus metallilatus]RXJ13203.1 hypothetical protein ERJ73_06570 [Deinococcus metallilatus]TLK23024.1 hypothetical protein FCS05_16745 [Deinococcus metallilatus]GMA15978.1 hypothetical protein GCM10025871_23090 [Deinococcus metallilatus]